MTQQNTASSTGHHSPMNGATLKTLREAMGLPVPWFAQFCAVQERTVRHWESGRNTVPIKVGAAILTLEKASLEMSDSIVSQARAITAQHSNQERPLPVVRYADDEDMARHQPKMKGLPTTFHAAAIARARWMLAGEAEIVAQMFETEAIIHMTPHHAKNTTKRDGAVPGEGDIVILKQGLGVSQRYRVVAILGSYPVVQYQGAPLNDDDEQIGRVETFSIDDIAQALEP